MDADLPARRELAKLLQVEVKVYDKWVDVSCVLGKKTLSTLFTTSQ